MYHTYMNTELILENYDSHLDHPWWTELKGPFMLPHVCFHSITLKYPFNCLKCFPFKGMAVLFSIRYRVQEKLWEGGN